MDLTIEGPALDDDVVEAMRRGLARMGRPDAEVVAANDLQSAVRRLDSSLSAYTIRRGSGEVAAKTIVTPEASVIVVNSKYLREASHLDVERVLAHEAGHLALEAHGETVSPGRLNGESEWRWKLRYLGGTALEEYRIERALYELGYGASEMAEGESVTGSLHALNCGVFEAMTNPQSHADVRFFEARILEVVSNFAKVLDYCGALSLSGRGRGYPERDLDRFGRANWDDFVGSHWTERIDFLATVPDVRESGTGKFTKEMWHQIATLEEKLLKRVGFVFEDAPSIGTYGFFRRQSDQDTQSRLDRATEEAMARESQA
ncbi:hypothetical protein [Amycolatopsis vastitatis]|uniref:hypothetical protein n=1 Tax=Amycolatopsis vastitatis TaxID=1905142 RepID=UPI001178146E|nr:hypothetical protein [Amycolatopsis vastitatis]